MFNHSRRGQPAISLYFLSDDAPIMTQLSCIWCKRTIADVKGHIDKMVSSPVDLVDVDIAINIQCKLCDQHYRMIVNSSET
jgi:hypothetical protein